MPSTTGSGSASGEACTERERRRLLREHPGVSDWYEALERARTRSECRTG